MMYGPRVPAKAKDAIQTSEALQSVLHVEGDVVDEVSSLRNGGMLVAGDGRIVGVMSLSANGVIGVPFAAVSKELSTVLRDETVTRPFLGVFAAPNDFAVVSTGAVDVRGAKIVAGPAGEAGVRLRSPADVGGLKVGDVVLTIDDQTVSKDQAIADILADYEPGDSVTLRVMGASGLRDVDVVLGMQPVR
jgi:S1-C subfamily serine protease